jgi:hypothetical protein
MVFSNTVPEDTHPQNTGFSRRRDCSCFKSLRLERRSHELMLQQKAAQTTAGFARQVEKRHLHLPGIKKSILF